MNNSTFPLVADVYTAQGAFEGSVTLKAGESYNWESDLSPFKGQGDRPITPFAVHWLCTEDQPYNYNPSTKKEKNQNEYENGFGTWPAVPPGGMVTAIGSPTGTQTCTVKKRKNKKTPKWEPIPHIDEKNDGYNNFSNDGGQTWTND